MNHGEMDVVRLFSKAVIYATFVLQYIANGHFFSFSPSVHKVTSSKSVCSSDRDCDPEDVTGEICWWLYDGCGVGECMCNPRTHVADPATGKCVVVRRSNEPCGLNDTCADSLTCVNGTCRCPHVHSNSRYDSYGGHLCLQPNYKFLGRSCHSAVDECYHESSYGYTSNEVECNSQTRRCSCKDGYKQDGRTCRSFHIWEIGCRKDFHCEGGAVCVDEQCACPTGYRSVAGNTKCAKIGAVLELPLGRRCDEINERRYCARGLVCHRCRDADAAREICARYLSGYEPDRSAYTSVSPLTKGLLSVSFLLPTVTIFLFHVVR